VRRRLDVDHRGGGRPRFQAGLRRGPARLGVFCGARPCDPPAPCRTCVRCGLRACRRPGQCEGRAVDRQTSIPSRAAYQHSSAAHRELSRPGRVSLRADAGITPNPAQLHPLGKATSEEVAVPRSIVANSGAGISVFDPLRRPPEKRARRLIRAQQRFQRSDALANSWGRLCNRRCRSHPVGWA